MLMKPRLQQIMDELVRAKVEARKFLTLEDAQITLGIMCSVGPTRFTGLLGDFRVRYPGISLRLVEGSLTQLCMRLEAGELDVAILASPAEFGERFNIRPLYRERFLVAFCTSHRFRQFETVAIAEMNGENYLRRLNCEFRETFAKEIRDAGCAINVCYQSEREDWIQNMAAGGLGVCFIPEFSAAMPGLLTRPVVEPEVWRQVSLVSMAGRRLSPALFSFVKAVSAYPWPQAEATDEKAA
jgi:DNA-binding transcriptional LysR family regulator